MTRMPDFEADIKRDWHAAADTMRHLTHPHHHDTPQLAAGPLTPAIPTIPTQAEDTTMGFATTLKHDAAEILGRVAQLDEAMLERAEQIAQIPGATDLVDEVLALGHVPPSLISAFTMLAKEIAAVAPKPQPVPQAIADAAAAQNSGM